MQLNTPSERARDLVARSGTVLGDIQVGAETVRAFVQVAPNEPPVELVVDILGLERFIERSLADAHAVFPDVDPVEGALRLASECLWEVTPSGDSPVSSAGIDRNGTVWRLGGERALDDLPHGNYRWDAEIDGPCNSH